MTLAAVGFERYAKTTRRATFFAEMERVVPWSALCALIEPFDPKPGNGRPPVGVERMRLPVAAKIALSTAGAATQIVGSPTPPQKLPDGMMILSTAGISSMRMI